MKPWAEGSCAGPRLITWWASTTLITADDSEVPTDRISEFNPLAAAVSLIGTAEWLIVLLVGIAHMPQVARVTRGVAADIVSREFVEFAEALSVPRWKILFGEILPNITTPLLVEFGIRIVWSISGIAALSIMGYGIQPPNADWGLMINENRGRITSRPLAVVSPALCIALFAFGINMIAEGIAGTMSGANRRSGGET